MKLLLLENDKFFNESIKIKFEQKGYDVHSYFNFDDAIENITNGYSCFILNLLSQNIEELNIVKKIREYYAKVPVIIISSILEIDIIKKAYKFGCDEYLKKPFHIDELEIKIDKLCDIPTQEIYYDNDSIFNFEESMITIDGVEKVLTQKENLLVNLFLLNINKLVSYENIQNYVWKGEYASIDAIRTLIRRLRKKMNKSTIKAASNRGYYFILEESK